MQKRRGAGDGSRVRAGWDDALALLGGGEEAERLLKGGEALHVIEEQWDDVLFVHQLFQEYFAARAVAARPEPELAARPWRAAEMAPSLEDTLAALADSDPLPAAPATGWEETFALAATMTRDPAGFVAALEAPNLPLAGRCAAQADVPIPPAQRQRLQQALMARSRDPEADLRARIAAARALGDLGDPRFERRRGPEGEYLLPPLVPIAGGEYPLGSDEGLYENEDPVHTVTLAPYAIGRFPVTNAEWQCFLDGRGYEDECWWDTEAGRRWRRGEDTAEGPKRQWRDTRRYFQDKPDRIGKALAEARIISKQAENYESYRTMADAEFEALLDTWYPPGRQTRPALWDDPASTIRPSRWWAPAGTRRGPMRLALGAERAGVPAADGSGMGRRRRGAGKGTATRGARRSTRPAAMLWRPMSAPPHRWASFPAATDRRVLRIWRATSGSGPGASMLPIPTGPMTAEKTRRMPRPDGWCAAAPGSTTEPPRAAPSAATARPATATSTWGCGWCVWLPSPEPLATGALRSVPLVF